MIRAKLLVGVYILQESSYKFKKSKDAICRLCKASRENTAHFLHECTQLEESRRTWKIKIDAMLEEQLCVPTSVNGWVKIVLNGGKGGMLCTNDWITVFNMHCNNLVYALHQTRTILLSQLQEEVVP